MNIEVIKAADIADGDLVILHVAFEGADIGTENLMRPLKEWAERRGLRNCNFIIAPYEAPARAEYWGVWRDETPYDHAGFMEDRNGVLVHYPSRSAAEAHAIQAKARTGQPLSARRFSDHVAEVRMKEAA